MMRCASNIALLVGVGAHLVLGSVLGGCGGQAVETAWVMPELATADADGRPFPPVALGMGSDRGRDDRPRGDYPEMAFVEREGFWRVDESRAAREARATGRGLFVDFYAAWSEPSRRLDDEVLRDVETRAAIAARYVPLRVDVTEESAKGRELLERFEVDRLPALVMVGPDGVEEERVVAVVSARELVERIRGRASAE